jgi:predicted phage terminase large subunit-like protein
MLYGGAAGSGKSIIELVGALQYVTVPGYSAILFRRTFADLNLPKALIPLSHAFLGDTDAAWNGQDRRWTFPSGAVLSFGYLETEIDKYRYQGAEFQFIGFDELTQFAKSQYTYLISRLRKPEGLPVPLRMRSATNPGGVGHDWVKKRFVDPKTSEDRVFVSAKLEDNPYLDRESYEESLNALDHITRQQLRHGNWDVRPDAGVFKPEWFPTFRRDDSGEFYLLGRSQRPVRIEECSRFAVADIAGTEKRKGNDPDYTVVGVFDLTTTHDLLTVHVWRGQFEIPDVEEKLMKVCWDYQVPYLLVEKAGIGLGVVQTVRRRGLNIKGLKARGSKLARAQTAMIRMEHGSVFFAEGSPWFGELQAEMLSFPTEGVHDDVVDVLSYSCQHVQSLCGPLKGMRDERGEADRVEKIETLETATIQAERMAEYERVQDEMMWQTTGGEGDYDSFGPSQATGL